MNCDSAALRIGASSYVAVAVVTVVEVDAVDASPVFVFAKHLLMAVSAAARASSVAANSSHTRLHRNASSSHMRNRAPYVASDVRRRKKASTAACAPTRRSRALASTPASLSATAAGRSASMATPSSEAAAIPRRVPSSSGGASSRACNVFGSVGTSSAGTHPTAAPIHRVLRRHSPESGKSVGGSDSLNRTRIFRSSTSHTLAKRHVDISFARMISINSPARSVDASSTRRCGIGRARLVAVGDGECAASVDSGGNISTPSTFGGRRSSNDHTKNSPRTSRASYSMRARVAALKLAETTVPARHVAASPADVSARAPLRSAPYTYTSSPNSPSSTDDRGRFDGFIVSIAGFTVSASSSSVFVAASSLARAATLDASSRARVGRTLAASSTSTGASTTNASTRPPPP